MRASLEFLLGLLERDDPPAVAAEDLAGTHGLALRLWQRMGFLAHEPGAHPVPTCPTCGEGVPYRLADRHVCSRCVTPIDRRHLLLWRLDLGAFLRWLARQLGLQGGVRRIDGHLWQLGTRRTVDAVLECFYRRAGPLTAAGRSRLAAYRSALLLYGLSQGGDPAFPEMESLCLLELLTLGEALVVAGWDQFFRRRNTVRFDPGSGTLWLGDRRLGEVSVGSRECAFLACLSEHLDRFVPYADLKHAVLRQSGGSDATEEATFCQNLKSRIKKKWIASIDQVIATTNKADGYRLRGHVELGTTRSR